MTTNREPGTERSERFRSYSPLRRTALVLGGAGADGAYQAGVLRALHEAGVKIDLVAGHGVGAASAALAAIDGAARLWEPDGVWQSGHARRLYGWTRPVRLALLCAAVALAALAALALPASVAALIPPARSVGIGTGFAVAMTTVLVAALAAGAWLVHISVPAPRRAHGAWWWRIAGAPLDAAAARERVADVLWQLIRGAAPELRPSTGALGRRYAEVLRENLGQPGFRELLLVATDLDARQDVVAALLAERWRGDFNAREGRPQRTEVIDLTGAGRDHAFDVVAAALTPPVGCEPAMVTFAADSRWRGETHRLCDRPGALHRLLEEAAAAGATQVVVVSAVAAADQPHRLRVPHLDPRRRLGEFQAAAEAAALRDALDVARLRFDAAYLICPTHNPVGPFDLSGAYDEASDRRQDLHELTQRAYEDAYRQFIEPVVGASGEQIGHTRAGGVRADVAAAGPVDDAGSVRIRDLD